MNANAIRFRSGTLDSLRGLTLFSMIAYHLCWDLVYLRGLPWAWYNGFWAYIWQQSICCTFILLSGYCCQASRHPTAGERSASSAGPPYLWQQHWSRRRSRFGSAC